MQSNRSFYIHEVILSRVVNLMLNSVLSLRHPDIYRTYFRNHELESLFVEKKKKKKGRLVEAKEPLHKNCTFFFSYPMHIDDELV
ncbi:unnamed protein product [Musa acuminata subsp. malaccensis]|uniref:(wild Malaysian banana) hypothetical protein n=1 Tax=Musa acuminata subsp. malaccensis TaxID=214687 RepID=A0A8D7FGA7_MUSAM|nr:unnamed protein product [Musa acuminata subsp. malaccensis]